MGFTQNSDIFYWVRQTDLTKPKEENDPDLTMSSCKPNEDSWGAGGDKTVGATTEVKAGWRPGMGPRNSPSPLSELGQLLAMQKYRSPVDILWMEV